MPTPETAPKPKRSKWPLLYGMLGGLAIWGAIFGRKLDFKEIGLGHFDTLVEGAGSLFVLLGIGLVGGAIARERTKK